MKRDTEKVSRKRVSFIDTNTLNDSLAVKYYVSWHFLVITIHYFSCSYDSTLLIVDITYSAPQSLLYTAEV